MADRNAKHGAPHAWTNGFLGVGGRLGADAVCYTRLPLVNDRLGYFFFLFHVGNRCSICGNVIRYATMPMIPITGEYSTLLTHLGRVYVDRFGFGDKEANC